MIYFYYGEETFQTACAVRAVRATHPTHDETVFYDCAEQYDLADVLYTLQAQSLFASQRMIVITHFFLHASAADQREMIAVVERPTDDIIIFTEEKTPRKNAPLFTWLVKHSTVAQQHEPLRGAAFDRWMRDRMQRHGMRSDAAAARALASAVGDDLWRLESEIVKLATYAHGRVCTVVDVEKLVHGAIEANMFTTIEVLCTAQRAEAMRLLRTQQAAGDSVHHIFAMYAYQVRTLLRVASAVEQGGMRDVAAIARLLGMKPFVVRKALAIVQRTSLARLKNVHHMLAVFDRDMKVGTRDGESALDLLVLGA